MYVNREEINELLCTAATSDARLKGVLGYETKPLVSSDYTNDARSVIVDAMSTMVVNRTQLKLFLWYDNEWGYVNRMAEIAVMMAGSMAGSH